VTGWRPALAALLVWAAHFFAAYGLMLAFPRAAAVAWLTLGLGLACLAILAWILRSTPRHVTVLAATLLAAVGIAWQSIVGLF